jgi:hypothetical protein
MPLSDGFMDLKKMQGRIGILNAFFCFFFIFYIEYSHEKNKELPPFVSCFHADGAGVDISWPESRGSAETERRRID